MTQANDFDRIGTDGFNRYRLEVLAAALQGDALEERGLGFDMCFYFGASQNVKSECGYSCCAVGLSDIIHNQNPIHIRNGHKYYDQYIREKLTTQGWSVTFMFGGRWHDDPRAAARRIRLTLDAPADARRFSYEYISDIGVLKVQAKVDACLERIAA